MKNVYFVQVDISANFSAQDAYLPYTAGILAANAWSSDIVRAAFCLKEFIFLRENIVRVMARLDNPAVMAFSCYCWNTEFNKALAAAVKERFPDCRIIFGGHNVPDDFTVLEMCPYVDILCHGEGEDTVRLLFEALAAGRGAENVPNISFRHTDGRLIRTKTECRRSLDSPSPYLEGWFDPIIEQHPEITFNAILETSRGCPNCCAYCDWGVMNAKVRLFPMERIKAEIRWMAEHKIAFVWGADANFGLFSRDLEIAKELAKTKKETGYPERMRMNYAKQNSENVFAIVKTFKACDFDRIGATLSFQSLSDEVLRNIGRTNHDLDYYKELLQKYKKENMRTYSELILGLPGETYESFIRGVGILFEIGQHFVFKVYECMVLPNSVMSQKDYLRKYGIKTVQTELIRPHFQRTEYDIPEYNTIVVETNSMSREMWVRSTMFYSITSACHGHGLLRAFAVYLYHEKGIPYETFYDGLIDYFESDPDLDTSKLYFEIKRYAVVRSQGTRQNGFLFEPTGGIIWDHQEYFVLRALENIDGFFRDVLPYLRSFAIESSVCGDLLAYQRAVLRVPDGAQTYADLQYDIHGFLQDAYVNDVHPLRPRKHRLILKDSNPMPDWPHFGKYVIWYGLLGWASYKDDVTAAQDESE